MIYLITLTPAIDKYIKLSELNIGKTNIVSKGEEVFGGKAVNAAKIISQYTDDYEIITCSSNQYDSFIKEQCSNLNLNLLHEKYIRTNLKIKTNNVITEINEEAPVLSKENEHKLEKHLIENVSSKDYVLIAGRIAEDNKKFILNLIKKLNSNIILDVPNFKYEDIKDLPILMTKPNEEEILNYLPKGSTNTLDEDVKEILNKTNIKELIVSLGADGSKYYTKDEMIKVQSLNGKVVNTVGAGDSYIGGYILGKYKGYDIKTVLQIANACGGATAFSKSIGQKKDIDEILKKQNIKID